MKKYIVKCILEVPVEVSDNYYNDEFTPEFDIEENHCPGTGIVGATFDKIKEEMDLKSCCWACAMKGRCEIIKEIHDTTKSDTV